MRVRDPGWKKVGSGIKMIYIDKMLLNPDPEPGSCWIRISLIKKVIYLLKPLQRYSGSGRNLQPNRENVGLPGSGSGNKFESGSISEILDRMHSKCFASALISVRIRILHGRSGSGSASGIVCQSHDIHSSHLERFWCLRYLTFAVLWNRNYYSGSVYDFGKVSIMDPDHKQYLAQFFK